MPLHLLQTSPGEYIYLFMQTRCEISLHVRASPKYYVTATGRASCRHIEPIQLRHLKYLTRQYISCIF